MAMTKPNYGAEIMGYWVLSVSPELLHKFRQEKKKTERRDTIQALHNQLTSTE